jgi:nucleoid DNA-binding protein
MRVAPIARQLIADRDFALSTPRRMLWTLGAVMLEGYARLQGYYDFSRRREHYIWQVVASTKGLPQDLRRVRRICHAQSVIVFRVRSESAEWDDANREREEREATEAVRKLLPHLRSKIRKEDVLSINGPGVFTAVIRAEQKGAEIVATRLKQAIEEAPVRVGARGRAIKLTVAYSTLTFASRASDGGIIISGPLLQEINNAN